MHKSSSHRLFSTCFGAAVTLALASVAIGGCVATAADRPDETRRPTGSIDRVDAQAYYFVNRQDQRKCAYPTCGGVFVGESNRDKAKCFDGKKAKDCYVAELDLSALGLDAQDEPDILAQANAAQVLVRGVFEPHPNNPAVARLVVSAAWEALTVDQPAGTRYLAFESPIVCVTYPCSNATASALNLNSGGSFAGFDTSALSADPLQLARLMDALGGNDGAILAGGLLEVSGPGGTASVIEVTAAYVPVKSSSADTPCGNTTCGAGSYCCNASCSMCAPEGSFCTQQACAPSCSHDYCEVGVALEANCTSVVSAVCAQDAFCCNNSWDKLCVEQADVISGGCTPEPLPEPPANAECVHSECETGVVLEPSCSSCAATVCAHDAYCCDTAWDSVCTDEATQLCGNTCAAPAPACAHSLCSIGEKLDPQCNEACVSTVCNADSYCCTVEWDNLCVTEAGQLCGYCSK